MEPATRRALVFGALLLTGMGSAVLFVAKTGEPGVFDAAKVEAMGYAVLALSFLASTFTIWAMWRSVQEARTEARCLILEELRNGDYHGYELRGLIAARTDEWIGLGTFYNALRALDAEGQVRSFEGEVHPATGRRLIRYQLTDKGRAALGLLQRAPFSKRDAILCLLADGRGWSGLDLIDASNGTLKRGVIYVTLARLEDEGLVTFEEVPVEREGLVELGLTLRRYRITDAGRKALETP